MQRRDEIGHGRGIVLEEVVNPLYGCPVIATDLIPPGEVWLISQDEDGEDLRVVKLTGVGWQ